MLAFDFDSPNIEEDTELHWVILLEELCLLPYPVQL